MGYHKKNIPKGIIGTSSKIKEELDELIDAEEQECKIMILCELSDLVGSIECYLEHNHPDITLLDLIKLSNLTKSAFRDGTRK